MMAAMSAWAKIGEQGAGNEAALLPEVLELPVEGLHIRGAHR